MKVEIDVCREIKSGFTPQLLHIHTQANLHKDVYSLYTRM